MTAMEQVGVIKSDAPSSDRIVYGMSYSITYTYLYQCPKCMKCKISANDTEECAKCAKK